MIMQHKGSKSPVDQASFYHLAERENTSMQTLNSYRQGIQDGEMWPGDGSHNVVSEGKPDKRKNVKNCL
jgi:hypothetical protein